MKDYDVAIIGGSGFIGSSLAKYLCNYFCVATYDVKSQPYWLEEYNIFHKICDIRDYNELARKIGNPSVVLHAAIIQIPFLNEKKELAYEVNVIGTQNVCKMVDKSAKINGLILTGSWHVFGEQELSGTIDEGFSYRPDKVEERARLYTLSKILQEAIVRFYIEKAKEKAYGIIRFGTVIGERMPEKTVANIFVTQALQGQSITPYTHSMYRPMFYVAIEDVCKGIYSLIYKILNNETELGGSNLDAIVNLAYPHPVTILDLAEIIKSSVIKHSNGRIKPDIKILNKGLVNKYTSDQTNKIKLDISKAKRILAVKKLVSPQEAIDNIVRQRLNLWKV